MRFVNNHELFWPLNGFRLAAASLLWYALHGRRLGEVDSAVTDVVGLEPDGDAGNDADET